MRVNNRVGNWRVKYNGCAFAFQTYNTDHQVPDSAATATAMFTGVKTRFGLVGVDDRVTRGDCDSYRPEMDLKSIFFIAKEAGRS
jgi:alkaline phosphatase